MTTALIIEENKSYKVCLPGKRAQRTRSKKGAHILAKAMKIGASRRGSKQSKSRLFADLAELWPKTFEGILEQQLKHLRVSNETYGRMSCIYLTFKNRTQRRFAEKLLKAAGHTVNPEYCPDHAVVEVTVTYFKGWHWNE